MAQITSRQIDSLTYECIVRGWENMKDGTVTLTESVTVLGSEPTTWSDWEDLGGRLSGYKRRYQSVSFTYTVGRFSPAILCETRDSGSIDIVYGVVLDHESGSPDLEVLATRIYDNYTISGRNVSESTYNSYLADLSLYKPC